MHTVLGATLEWNDAYRAMVVGLAADYCAVGGVSVDDELLISFWWRTPLGDVTRGPLGLL